MLSQKVQEVHKKQKYWVFGKYNIERNGLKDGCVTLCDAPIDSLEEYGKFIMFGEI